MTEPKGQSHERDRTDFGRVVLLYGARTPADVLYAHELEQWGKHDDFQVLVTVHRADPSWRSAVGVVTELFPRCRFEPRRIVPELHYNFAK